MGNHLIGWSPRTAAGSRNGLCRQDLSRIAAERSAPFWPAGSSTRQWSILFTGHLQGRRRGPRTARSATAAIWSRPRSLAGQAIAYQQTVVVPNDDDGTARFEDETPCCCCARLRPFWYACSVNDGSGAANRQPSTLPDCTTTDLQRRLMRLELVDARQRT